MSALSFYEDVHIGQTINFGSYSVSQDEIVSFAEKWDPQPFHIDEQAAEESVFKGISACSAHVFSIMSLLAHSETAPLAVAAGLGMKEMKLSAPLRPGHVVSVNMTTTGKRPSKSYPDRGIVERLYELVNEQGEVLCSQHGIVLVYRKKP